MELKYDLTDQVNAIVLWNTVYLARAVAYARPEGAPFVDEEIAHIAPMKWSNIALTSDYLWSQAQRPRRRFRRLRTRRFDPSRFAIPWRTILQKLPSGSKASKGSKDVDARYPTRSQQSRANAKRALLAL